MNHSHVENHSTLANNTASAHTPPTEPSGHVCPKDLFKMTMAHWHLFVLWLLLHFSKFGVFHVVVGFILAMLMVAWYARCVN